MPKIGEGARAENQAPPTPKEAETPELVRNLESIEKLQIQLSFAKHTYDNQQALLRQLDVKAGVMLSILVFLTAAVLPLSEDVTRRLCFTGRGSFTSWVFLVSGIILVTSLLVTAAYVQQVITARRSFYESVGKRLMFAYGILEHGSPENYHGATAEATADDLLMALTSEIYQLSGIAAVKMRVLKTGRWPTAISGIAWAVYILSATYIMTWK